MQRSEQLCRRHPDDDAEHAREKDRFAEHTGEDSGTKPISALAKVAEHEGNADHDDHGDEDQRSAPAGDGGEHGA